MNASQMDQKIEQFTWRFVTARPLGSTRNPVPTMEGKMGRCPGTLLRSFEEDFGRRVKSMRVCHSPSAGRTYVMGLRLEARNDSGEFLTSST